MAEIMNIMLKCISQGLLHSIWQSIIIYGIYLILMQLTRKYASVYRYWISVSLYAIALLSLIITLGGVIRNAFVRQLHNVDFSYIRNTNDVITINAPNPIVEGFSSLIAMLDNWLPYITLLWVIGFGYYIVRYFGELRTIQRLCATASPFSTELYEYIQRVCLSVGLRKKVQFFTSPGIISPITFGSFKPVVIMATKDISRLATSTMQSLLMHEVAHIKRHDYVVNSIQILIDGVFFFNPLLRGISERIRKERELCCDEMVVLAGVSPVMYARALTDLYSNNLESRLSLGLTGGLLSYRVVKIVAPTQKPKSTTCIVFFLLSALIIIGMIDSSRTQYYTVNGVDYTIEQFHAHEKSNQVFKEQYL